MCASVCEAAVSVAAVSVLVGKVHGLHKATLVLNKCDSITYGLRRHDEGSERSCWMPVRSHGLSSRSLIASRPSID